jgi:hypothetical protein
MTAFSHDIHVAEIGASERIFCFACDFILAAGFDIVPFAAFACIIQVSNIGAGAWIVAPAQLGVKGTRRNVVARMIC